MNIMKTGLGSKFATFLLIGANAAVLSACAVTPKNPDEMTNSARIDSALERAAVTAGNKGEELQSLAILERLYKRNSENPKHAVNYAKGLRRADRLNRAALVIAPFAEAPNGPAAAKAEYAAIMTAMGRYESAEIYARQALDKQPDEYTAWHILGVSLDARQEYKPAERAYRKALEVWQGNPVPVMNNLALNLATQGYLDEASQILQKALAVAPERGDVERNLRIVNALQKSTPGLVNPIKEDKKRKREHAAHETATALPFAPVPGRKPGNLE